MPIVSDPWFYIMAIPAVLIYGIGKGGLGGALGDHRGSVNSTHHLSYSGSGNFTAHSYCYGRVRRSSPLQER